LNNTRTTTTTTTKENNKVAASYEHPVSIPRASGGIHHPRPPSTGRKQLGSHKETMSASNQGDEDQRDVPLKRRLWLT
jgi:hypothetical protein